MSRDALDMCANFARDMIAGSDWSELEAAIAEPTTPAAIAEFEIRAAHGSIEQAPKRNKCGLGLNGGECYGCTSDAKVLQAAAILPWASFRLGRDTRPIYATGI